MSTRAEWNSYKLQDGLNIWGAPNFQGSPVLAGGFTFGDAIADTLIIKGRVATMSLSGDYVEIPSTYTQGELVEIRAKVNDWTGVGSEFRPMYIRGIIGIASTGKTLRGLHIDMANADGLSIGTLTGIYVNPMGKGNSTLTLMRGAEVKCEWLSTDTVTDATLLRLEFMGLAAPTNTIFGIRFEKESAAAAMVAKFHEIRMKEGMHILSGSGAPSMVAPKGSLYLRTDGSGTTNRAYINTDGSTTWTAITTSA